MLDKQKKWKRKKWMMGKDSLKKEEKTLEQEAQQSTQKEEQGIPEVPIAEQHQERVSNPDFEFKKANGLLDAPEKNTGHKINPDNSVSYKTPVTEQKGEGFFTRVYYPQKRIIPKTLTILLIENTEKVSQQKEKVLQLVNAFTKSSDLLYIMNYRDVVQETEMIDLSAGEPIMYFEEGVCSKACFFDAILEVEKLVLSKYLKTETIGKEEVRIDSIEIIGIGTGTDNASVASKEEALDSFSKISLRQKVVTKYYCLEDQYFLGPAEIGFHSIGSISRVYQ